MDSIAGLALLKAFTKFDLNINNATMMVFLTVARRGECIQRNLEEELGLSNASASRNVSYWTDDIQRSTGKPGPGLIERKENPTDRRYKILRLTPKGREFYEEIRRIQNVSTKRFEMAS